MNQIHESVMIPIVQQLKIKRINKLAVVFLMLVTTLALSSCDTTDPDEDESTIGFTGSFIAIDETVETSASGNIVATYDPVPNELSFTIVWNDLSSPVTGMYLEIDGSAAQTIDNWEPVVAGEIIEEVTLDESEEDELLDENMSVVIETENYPEGEIQAFLVE